MRYSVATVVIAATFAATQPALAAPVASVPSTSGPSNNHDDCKRMYDYLAFRGVEDSRTACGPDITWAISTHEAVWRTPVNTHPPALGPLGGTPAPGGSSPPVPPPPQKDGPKGPQRRGAAWRKRELEQGSAGQQNRRRDLELEFRGGGDVVQLVRAAARRRAVEQLYAQMDGMVDELYYARTYAMVEQLYVRTGAMLDEFD